MKGPVQQCVKYDIDVLRKKALNVFKFDHLYKDWQVAKRRYYNERIDFFTSI